TTSLARAPALLSKSAPQSISRVCFGMFPVASTRRNGRSTPSRKRERWWNGLKVTDNNGLSDTANTLGELEALVVIYDPAGGYVTGGGWIDSPAGALAANPSLTGKASFGFVSKYFKSARNPKGETQFD